MRAEEILRNIKPEEWKNPQPEEEATGEWKLNWAVKGHDKEGNEWRRDATPAEEKLFNSWTE